MAAAASGLLLGHRVARVKGPRTAGAGGDQGAAAADRPRCSGGSGREAR